MSEPDDRRSTDLLTIASRFNGPPGSGNGGYVAGLLAGRLPKAAAVTVTLRQPPPLERDLTVAHESDGTLRLVGDAEAVVAEAAPTPDDVLGGAGFEPVDPVPFEAAAESSAAFYAGRRNHPFPTCFVCGTDRAEGDGMRLFSGMLPQQPGTTACTWVPDPSLTGPDGSHVRPEFVWAALDCPGGWTAMGPDEPLLLGRFTARIDAIPYLGERCVVMGRLLSRDGRKVRTATTLYDPDGRVAAQAEALWIAPRRAA